MKEPKQLYVKLSGVATLAEIKSALAKAAGLASEFTDSGVEMVFEYGAITLCIRTIEKNDMH